MNRSDIIKLIEKKELIIGLVVAFVVSLILFLIFKPSNKEFKGKKKTKEETYYVVKFDSDGGSSVSDIKVKENEKIKLPKEPTKEGYTFANWYDEDENVVSSETVVKNDMTLKAKWIKKESKIYTVTFNTNGGSYIAPIKVSDDEPLKLPKKPTKEGYTFANWVDENNLIVREDVQISEDMTIYVEWIETYICPAGFKKNGKKCIKTVASSFELACEEGTLDEENEVCFLKEKDFITDLTCPDGYSFDNNICTSLEGVDPVDDECLDDYQLFEDSCYHQVEATETKKCPNNTSLINGACYQTEDAEKEYSCPKDYELDEDDNSKCQKIIDATLNN